MNNLQTFFLILLCGWSIGISSIFIYHFVMQDVVYMLNLNTVDLYFDWFGLFFLGVINMVLNAKDLYQRIKHEQFSRARFEGT
jgi:hypothetical protein